MSSILNGNIPNIVYKKDTRIYVEVGTNSTEVSNRVDTITSPLNAITDDIEITANYDDLGIIHDRTFRFKMVFYNDYDRLISINGFTTKEL